MLARRGLGVEEAAAKAAKRWERRLRAAGADADLVDNCQITARVVLEQIIEESYTAKVAHPFIEELAYVLGLPAPLFALPPDEAVTYVDMTNRLVPEVV